MRTASSRRSAAVVALGVALTACGGSPPLGAPPQATGPSGSPREATAGPALPAGGAGVPPALPVPDVAVPDVAVPDVAVPDVAVTEVAVTGALAGLPRQAPTHLALPAIGVGSPIVPLGLDDHGALEVPRDPAVAGWYVGSVEPGEPGPTVIAGHVDSRTGPGVFSRLSQLRAGDEVSLTRADGRPVRYRVDRVEQHAKDAFPTDAVYATDSRPQLRLITCGGGFDRGSSRYQDNVVVYASLAPPRAP